MMKAKIHIHLKEERISLTKGATRDENIQDVAPCGRHIYYGPDWVPEVTEEEFYIPSCECGPAHIGDFFYRHHWEEGKSEAVRQAVQEYADAIKYMSKKHGL